MSFSPSTWNSDPSPSRQCTDRIIYKVNTVLILTDNRTCLLICALPVYQLLRIVRAVFHFLIPLSNVIDRCIWTSDSKE